jgi:hypothetical protein
MKPWLSNCVDVKLRIGHAIHNTNNRLYIDNFECFYVTANFIFMIFW